MPRHLAVVPPTSAAVPDRIVVERVATARALGAAVAYGRAARVVRASPYTLARLVRTAPAADEAARRACVWAALAAYFGARASTGDTSAATLSTRPPPRSA